MNRIIGIDLGTTNSCVAALDERGQPVVLAAPDGARTVPSIVAFTDTTVLVGEAARRQLVNNPARTVFGSKRMIGRKVNSNDVRFLARSAPFRIVAAPNGDAWVRTGNEPLSPQEIASHVIRHLKEVAERALGEPVTRAVVTVPAYFDDAQRQATKDAGTIAGVDVVRILNEPTAAALAYGYHRDRPGRHVIGVFDLGGGTFDISIMAVEDGVFEVLATSGDSTLGGDDWDRRLIERLVDEVFDKHRLDLSAHPVAMGRLKEAAQNTKINLAHQQEDVIKLPFLAQADGRDFHLERKVTRTEFEQLTAELIERLHAPCRQALSDARLTPADLEEVLLVGGMTRWPKVQEAVAGIFGRQPSKGTNPDEAVALGAAAYAGILAGSLDDAVLLDVTAHTIGVKVGNSGFARMIPRNSMLPVRERKLFATSEDDQDHVKVEIYQGESEDLLENRKLGEVKLTGLPPGKAGSVRVELIMTVDVESILRVSAREMRTGKRALVTIAPSGGLSQEDLVRIVGRRRRETMEAPASPELERPGEE